MTPIFTVHAGEYLVGSYLERELRNCRVWIPSKDTGIDMLLTNESCSRAVPLQIKYSRDYVESSPIDPISRSMTRSSFIRVQRRKIQTSAARYWIIVLHSFTSRSSRYVVVNPSELLKRIEAHHGRRDIYSLYFCVVGDAQCWEVRGLRRRQLRAALDAGAVTPSRDFSRFLDDWSKIRYDIAA